MQQIEWNDFTKVELRVGRTIQVEVFQQARKPAYILQVDFGEELGIRKSSVQITKLYQPENLIGKLVVAGELPEKADWADSVRMSGDWFS